MLAVLSTLLEVIAQLIGAALGVLAGAARLAGLGTLQTARLGRERLALWHLHRSHPYGPRGRAWRLWSPQAARRALLVVWGALAGTLAALLRGAPMRAGALLGGIVALVLIAAELRHRRAQLARARHPRIVRLFNVARAEWSVPTDSSPAWWVAVRRWEPWPDGLLPGILPAGGSRRRRRALGRLERAASRPTFPALIRWRLPDDYRPTAHARQEFAEHLAEATGIDREEGYQWTLTWDLPMHAVWAELGLTAIEAPYPAGWPAAERPSLIPVAVRRSTREVVCWNPTTDPHGAIAGRTGTGKTVSIGVLTIGAGRAGWDAYLIDGKMTGLGIFRGRQGVRRVALEPDEWWATIDTVYDELQGRKRTLARGGSIDGRPPVLLVVDEVPTVLALERGRGADVAERNVPRREAQRKLTEIAQQGRGLDVHYWPTGQRLAAVAVEGPQKENLSALIVLRSSRVGSLQAMESSAAANLPKIPGRAAWTDARHDGDEVQVFGWAPEVPGAPALERLLPLEVAELEGLQVPDDASAIIG